MTIRTAGLAITLDAVAGDSTASVRGTRAKWSGGRDSTPSGL